MVIGERISQLRRARRLTQKYVAQQVGRSVATVRRWERGGLYPNAPELRVLCAVLGCGFWYLVGVGDIPHGLGALSTDEIALVADYRAAGEAAKMMVAACLHDIKRVVELLGG